MDTSLSSSVHDNAVLIPYLRKLTALSSRLPTSSHKYKDQDYEEITTCIDNILNAIPLPILSTLTPESKKLRSIFYRTIPSIWFDEQFSVLLFFFLDHKMDPEQSPDHNNTLFPGTLGGGRLSVSEIDTIPLSTVVSVIPVAQRLLKLMDIFIRDDDLSRRMYSSFFMDYIGSFLSILVRKISYVFLSSVVSGTAKDTDTSMDSSPILNESLVSCTAAGLQIIVAFINNYAVSVDSSSVKEKDNVVTTSSTLSSSLHGKIHTQTYGIYSVNLLILLSDLLHCFALLSINTVPLVPTIDSVSGTFRWSPQENNYTVHQICASLQKVFQYHEKMYIRNALTSTASFTSSSIQNQALSATSHVLPVLYQGILQGGGKNLIGILVRLDRTKINHSQSIVIDTYKILYQWLSSVNLIYPSLAIDLDRNYVKHSIKPWDNAEWIYTLREIIIQTISEPLPWTENSFLNETTTNTFTEPSSFSTGKKIQSLRILSLCLTCFGTVWLFTDHPSLSTDEKYDKNSNGKWNTGYKFTLLLIRLLGTEIKLCIDEIEDLIILSSSPSTIELAYNMNQQNSRTIGSNPNGTLTNKSAWISSISKRTPTREQRTRLLYQRYPTLSYIYCQTIDIFTKLINLLSSLSIASNTPSSIQSSASTPFPYNLSSTLLIPLHEALSPITGILITFLNDTYTSSEVRLILNVLPSLDKYTVPSINLENLASSLPSHGHRRKSNDSIDDTTKENEEEDYLSLGWRCKLFEFFAAITTHGICTYLMEDTEAFRSEFIDILPLMIQVSSYSSIGVPDLSSLISIAKIVNTSSTVASNVNGGTSPRENIIPMNLRIKYLPLSVPIDHPYLTLLPVIVSRFENSFVSNLLGMDLSSSSNTVVMNTILGTSMEVLRNYGRTITVATMAADALQNTLTNSSSLVSATSSPLLSISSPFRSSVVTTYGNFCEMIIEIMLSNSTRNSNLLNFPSFNYLAHLGVNRLIPFIKDFRTMASRFANPKLHALAYYTCKTSTELFRRLCRRYVTLTAVLLYSFSNSTSGSTSTTGIETSFNKLQIASLPLPIDKESTNAITTVPPSSEGIVVSLSKTMEMVRSFTDELRDITFDIFKDVVRLNDKDNDEDYDDGGERRSALGGRDYSNVEPEEKNNNGMIDENRTAIEQRLFDIVLDCLAYSE